MGVTFAVGHACLGNYISWIQALSVVRTVFLVEVRLERFKLDGK